MPIPVDNKSVLGRDLVLVVQGYDSPKGMAKTVNRMVVTNTKL